MSRRKYNDRLKEAIRRRAEDKREKEAQEHNKDYQPRHPDNK